MRERRWLDLQIVEDAVRAARDSDVAVRATSRGGFAAAFRRAEGDPDRLGIHRRTGTPWRRRRNAFLARHIAQTLIRREPLWRNGAPTARHLALAVWAYSPTPARLARWLKARE